MMEIENYHLTNATAIVWQEQAVNAKINGYKNEKQTRYLHKLGAVAHTCNPSHSGNRDQEDCSLKPVQASS
jgi:hypothetical protein